MKKMKKIPDQYKYITTTEFNKLTKEYFAERLKQVNLASKTDISDFLKRTGFDKKLRKINNKVTSSKAKDLTNGYSIITVARNLIEDESQNYLSIFKCLLVLIKLLHGNLKDCQKRVSKPQLHQARVFPQN